jgi:hypothetical protein
MRISRKLCVGLLLCSIGVSAESKNPADYPLRVHVFTKSQIQYLNGMSRTTEEAKGEGRANLFEGGEAKAIEFTFDCPEKLRASSGFETYPAKWKKPGQELVVLMPVFGKGGSFFTCSFKTDVKDYAIATSKGQMHKESVEKFKAWMVRHQYDPEHGKDVPVKSTADADEEKTDK